MSSELASGDNVAAHAPRGTPGWLTRLNHLPVFVLFIAITLVMSWPYARQIQTSLYNWSDALLNTWTLAWGTHALLTDPLNLYNANIFYPYANTLAYSESLLPQTALAMPVILLTNMPALAHNLLALSSFVLAAFGAYLLVFDLTRSRSAGLVAGMIYTFTSYKMMHVAHLQLLSSQWMPFALLYLKKMLASFPSRRDVQGARLYGRGVRYALLFALFFSLQALSSFYYAFFIAVAAVLYTVYVFGLRVWSRTVRQMVTTKAVPIVIAVVVIAAITIPSSLPYFAVQRELGLERETQDVEYYAATVRTYFSVPDGNWLYGHWLAPRSRMTGSGERDFVGFVALALALVGLIARPRRDAEKWFYVLLALAGVILSFGARNQILSFPRWPTLTLPFYLPFRYLFEWVPGFKAMRGPDRFAYLAVLGIAVLAGYGTWALLKRISPARAWLATAAPLLLVGLIGLENIAVPLQATNPATLARPVPDFAQFLAQDETHSAVLEIPMQYDSQWLAWPQYYSIYHWHTLVNGFSGFFPPGYEVLGQLTQQFPSEASLAVLDEIGVRTVVAHTDLLSPAEQKGIQARLAEFRGRVELVRHFATADIYQLNDSENAWGAQLAQAIPNGARVWLNNSQADSRELFELAAAMLHGRDLYGDANAAYRPLPPPDANRPADFVIMNANDDPPDGFSRRIWANEYMTVYAR